MSRVVRWRVAAGLLAVLLVVVVTRGRAPEPPPPVQGASVAAPVETRNVLFARRQIPRGTAMLSAALVVDHFELRKNVPVASLPAARLATQYQDVLDLIALESIERGEPVVLDRFATFKGMQLHGLQPGPRDPLP